MGAASRVIARALVRHPELWLAALTETARLARPRWWRAFPPRPLPTPELWRFRMVTAYGGEGDRAPDASDVVSFVHWCRDMRRWRKV